MKYLTIKTVPPDLFKRIASKIDFDECWSWKGAKTNQGYGYLRYENKQQLVHRMMYVWFNEKIPMGRQDNAQIDHICNNPICCNPKHLRLTTQKVNVLRGVGPSAINSRKTACVRGHTLPEKPNRPDGGRRCLICRRINDRIYWQKRKPSYVRHKASSSL